MRRWSICLFIKLFVSVATFAQHPMLQQIPSRQAIIFNSLPFSVKATPIDSSVNTKNLYAPVTVIPLDYYTKTLGFFCRKVIQIEKTIRFPLKLRLGSVAYTDKMEGKGAGTALPNKRL
jgi:hypothetical protein